MCAAGRWRSLSACLRASLVLILAFRTRRMCQRCSRQHAGIRIDICSRVCVCVWMYWPLITARTSVSQKQLCLGPSQLITGVSFANVAPRSLIVGVWHFELNVTFGYECATALQLKPPSLIMRWEWNMISWEARLDRGCVWGWSSVDVWLKKKSF